MPDGGAGLPGAVRRRATNRTRPPTCGVRLPRRRAGFPRPRSRSDANRIGRATWREHGVRCRAVPPAHQIRPPKTLACSRPLDLAEPAAALTLNQRRRIGI
ncbi:hypothetical protein SEVIR_9G457032v4 [Setaria viridis]